MISCISDDQVGQYPPTQNSHYNDTLRLEYFIISHFKNYPRNDFTLKLKFFVQQRTVFCWTVRNEILRYIKDIKGGNIRQ